MIILSKKQTTSNAHITGGATRLNGHELHLWNATFLTDLSSQAANLQNPYTMTSGNRISVFSPVGTSPERNV